MDEIALDLHMSKNTIYKLFVGKEEIAKALVKRLQQQLNTSLDNIEKTQKTLYGYFQTVFYFCANNLAPGLSIFLGKSPPNCLPLGRISSF